MEQLQTASRYETAAVWPQYLRGQTHLKLRRGAEAAAEFHKILEHRGYAPLSVLYLGLGRAAAPVTWRRAGKLGRISLWLGRRLAPTCRF